MLVSSCTGSESVFFLPFYIIAQEEFYMWRQFILEAADKYFTRDTSKMSKNTTASQMEFAVNMSSRDGEESIRNALEDITGIESLSIDVSSQRVLITTTQPSSLIQTSIETTGMLAVLKGQDGKEKQHLGAAVSIVKRDQKTYGLIRFLQTDEKNCIIDGSFSGLEPGKYGLHIHELGDLSQGCESTGDDFNPNNGIHGDRFDKQRHAGDMGNVEVNGDGKSVFRYEDDLIKVWDIIGRSVVLHENEDDFTNARHGNAGKGFACGIIARSAGLFENTKKVCTCTGKTIWEERAEVREEIG